MIQGDCRDIMRGMDECSIERYAQAMTDEVMDERSVLDVEKE